MSDIPNVRCINLVDTPAAIKYNAFGQAQVPLDPSTMNIIDLSGFRQASIQVGTTKATSCQLYMGKGSGATLAHAYDVPLDGSIHTFEVVGPQMWVWLSGGPKSSQEKVQVWVYLRS